MERVSSLRDITPEFHGRVAPGKGKKVLITQLMSLSFNTLALA